MFLSSLCQRSEEKKFELIFCFVMKHFVVENRISRETKLFLLNVRFQKGFCMPGFEPWVKVIGKTVISKSLQCAKYKQRT